MDKKRTKTDRTGFRQNKQTKNKKTGQWQIVSSVNGKAVETKVGRGGRRGAVLHLAGEQLLESDEWKPWYGVLKSEWQINEHRARRQFRKVQIHGV